MSCITEEYITAIVSRIAFVHNLKNWKYSREKFDSIGQNYFGVIIPITLSGSKETKEIELHVVLKLAPTDEAYRVSGAVTLMFAREIFVYTCLLKKYQDLQRHFSPTSKLAVPKSYYAHAEYCQEVIALQDMSALGYQPFVKGMFLDLNHTLVSLKSLAQLHALSFILREKDKKLYSEVLKVCIPLNEKTNKRFMDIMKDRLNKALAVFKGTEYTPLLNRLEKNCARIFNNVVEQSTKMCICHGDIWKENILYKYEENQPVSACLIDYQTARICSPAYDVLFLIITSTDTNLRSSSHTQLLDVYYHTFDQTLSEAGLKSQSIYAKEDFEKDFRVVAPACLITANTALWLANGLQQEGHVRSKIVWETPEERTSAEKRYQAIIQAIIDDFCAHGYLYL